METRIVNSYPNGHDSTGVLERTRETSSAVIDSTGGLERKRESAPALKIISATSEADVPLSNIPIQDIYPSIQDISPELDAANRLIMRSMAHIEDALAAHGENQLILADDAMQSVQALLPELFCFRNVGEGFGMVVNGLLCAFQNLGGLPLERRQIEKVRQTFQSLRAEPFMSSDRAIDKLDELEQKGFKLEPPEFHVLAELLDE